MFSLEIDLKLLEELNKKTLSNLKNKQQIENKIGVVLLKNSKQSFPNQKSPEGKKWKRSTAAKKRKGLTLVDTGELSEGLEIKNVSSEIIGIVASDIADEYGYKHQFGGFIRTSDGDEIPLPPRPFAGLTEEGKKEVIKIIIEGFFNA